jgi:D-alanine-D-alanine ligase
MRALAEQARALASGDDTRSVKKSLADRAEGVRSAAAVSLARTEPAGSVPAELRQGLDVVFIALHGPYGEDGTIQGLLEMADVPYVGAGVLASAVGMDKATMKTIFRAHGLPIVEHVVVSRRDWRARHDEVVRDVLAAVGVPCFVKPCNLGSSVGISKVTTVAALPAALDEAARHDRKIIVERAIPRVREVEVSVLGNDEPQTSLPGEIVYESEWYDYATKYAEGQARLVCPAPISPALTARIRELAVAAYRAVDCAGMARVDFFLDGPAVLVNEINTIPGFTSTSGYARMWEATGLAYPDLVQRLVDLALERYRDK